MMRVDTIGKKGREERKKTEKKAVSRYSKRKRNIVIILVLSSVFVCVGVNADNLSPGSVMGWTQDKLASFGIGGGYPVKLTGDRVYNKNFRVLDHDIAFASDSSFVCLNNSGKEITSRRHGFHNPVFKANGSVALLYDIDGTGFSLERKSKNLYKGCMKGQIIAGDVSCNGDYALITKSRDFLGELTVYRRWQDDYCYKYYFAESYAANVAISNSGSMTAVCCFSTEKEDIASIVYVFDYKSEKPMLKFTYEGSMITDMKFLSNGNIIVVADNMVSLVNIRRGEKKEYTYSGKELRAFSVDCESGVAIGLESSAEGERSCILRFDVGLNLESEISLQNEVKSLSLSRSRVAALEHGKVNIYELNGGRCGSFDCGSDAQEIAFMSGRGVYVLGLTEVRRGYI